MIISAPKTKASIRTVILPPSLLKTLAVYKETVNSDWMFPSPTDNGRPRNPSSVRKRLQLILERAGCVTMINDHLYEGRYTPTNAYGKRESHNIYAKTREECEEKLAEMIAEVKAQIKAEKEKMTG